MKTHCTSIYTWQH